MRCADRAERPECRRVRRRGPVPSAAGGGHRRPPHRGGAPERRRDGHPPHGRRHERPGRHDVGGATRRGGGRDADRDAPARTAPRSPSTPCSTASSWPVAVRWVPRSPVTSPAVCTHRCVWSRPRTPRPSVAPPSSSSPPTSTPRPGHPYRTLPVPTKACPADQAGCNGAPSAQKGGRASDAGTITRTSPLDRARSRPDPSPYPVGTAHPLRPPPKGGPMPGRTPPSPPPQELPRVMFWRLRRDPLRRRSDLAQAWIGLGLALAVSAGTPLAMFLVGDAAHRHYARNAQHQAATRHHTTAVLVEDAPRHPEPGSAEARKTRYPPRSASPASTQAPTPPRPMSSPPCPRAAPSAYGPTPTERSPTRP